MKHSAEPECLQDLKNELDALGRQVKVKISAPMIKNNEGNINSTQLEICGSRWYALLLAEKVYRVTCSRSALDWLTKETNCVGSKAQRKGRCMKCHTSDQLHAYAYH